MLKPPTPSNEAARIESLNSVALLDTPPDERFDRYTRLARRLLSTPISLISLIDSHRQWIKSSQGFNESELSREYSFCGHTLLEEYALVIPDAKQDERFSDNPLVEDKANIRFYAGVPICAPDGHRIGTLSIMDTQPRELAQEDLCVMQDIASMVEEEIINRFTATTDDLTNLTNRRGFLEIANHSLMVCARSKTPAVLLLFDLDNFTLINDKYGYEEGNNLLKNMAYSLTNTFRDSDVIARIGNDEFCVLLTVIEENAIQSPLNRLKQKFEAEGNEQTGEYALSYSVGIVSFDPERHKSIHKLIEEADRLTKQHKQKVHLKVVS